MSPDRLHLPAFLAMEALWLYAAVSLFVAGAEPPEGPPFLAVAAALAGGYGAVWFSRNLDLAEGTARAVGVGLGVATMVAIVRLAYAGDLAIWQPGVLGDLVSEPGPTFDAHPGGVTSTLALAAIWGRGAWLARRQTDGLPELASFATGLAVVGLGLAVGDATDTDAPRYVALPFGALGLAAIALGHVTRLSLSPGGRTPRWFAGVLAGGLGAGLALAAILALLPWSATLNPLAKAGDGLSWAVGWLLIITLTPIFLAVDLGLRALFGLLGQLGLELGQPLEPDSLRDLALDEEERDSSLPGWLGPAVRLGTLAILALVGLWVASLLFLRRQVASVDSPERASLWTAGQDRQHRSWFDRFRRLAVERPGAGAIGRLYGELLEQAARQGLPRAASQTPHEFAPEMANRLDLPVAVAISHAFARARYGGLSVSDGEVGALRTELRRTPERRST